jgi:hypothetical protein
MHSSLSAHLLHLPLPLLSVYNSVFCAPQVARQSPADTAALLESILITPDVKVGEANQIISKSRPRPRHFVKAPTDTPEAPPADTPKEPEKTEPSEPTTPTEPAPAPKEPLPPCPVLKNTDSTEVKKVASPNWGLQRIDSRDALSKDYEYASAGAGANVFIVDTGVQVGDCMGSVCGHEQTAGAQLALTSVEGNMRRQRALASVVCCCGQRVWVGIRCCRQP